MPGLAENLQQPGACLLRMHNSSQIQSAFKALEKHSQLFRLPVSTCCFSGCAQCQRGFCRLNVSWHYFCAFTKAPRLLPHLCPIKSVKLKTQPATVQAALLSAASWLHGVPTSPRNTAFIQVQMSCNVCPPHTRRPTHTLSLPHHLLSIMLICIFLTRRLKR